MNGSTQGTASQAGPSRPRPITTNAFGKPIDCIDLTLSSDDEDGIVVLPRRSVNKGPLKATSKSNIPQSKHGSDASSSGGASKVSASQRMAPSSSLLSLSARKRKGEFKEDAISISSSTSSRSVRSGAGVTHDSPNRTPRVSAAPSGGGGGGFGKHKPAREKSATPALGERGRMGRTVSREKIELGSGSSVTGRGRSVSVKRDKGDLVSRLNAKIESKKEYVPPNSSLIIRIKAEKSYPIFTGSSKPKIKAEPKPSPVQPSPSHSAASSSHSRKASSSRTKYEPMPSIEDEADAFFASPAISKRVGSRPVISAGSAARAAIREKSQSVVSADRTPTKSRSLADYAPASREKRKRSHVSEEQIYAPRKRQTSVALASSSAAPRGRVRSERTANQPPVNYVVPTMDDPLSVWTRDACARQSTPKGPGASSVLSSAPESTRKGSISSSSTIPTIVADADEAEPSAKRFKKSKSKIPRATRMVRTGSESSALTALSSQPTPSRSRRMSSVQRTPIGRKLQAMASHNSQMRSGHPTPSKTPRQKKEAKLIDVRSAEPDADDLFAEFADFDFAPDSPEAPVVKVSPTATPSVLSGAGEADHTTPTHAGGSPPSSIARRLSYTSTPASAVKVELTPEELAKKREEELDAKIARENEIKAAAVAKAEADREARWARHTMIAEDKSDDEPEPEDSLLALTRKVQENLSKTKARKQSSVSPAPARPIKKSTHDRAAEKFIKRIAKDHERDTSFEMALEYSRSESRSPQTSTSGATQDRQAFSYPTPTSRDPSLEPMRRIDPDRMIPEVVIPVGRRAMPDAAKVSLQDLDEEMRGGTAEVIRAAKLAEEAERNMKVDKGWMGPWGAVGDVEMERKEVDVSKVYVDGMWDAGVKSAQAGDFTLLGMLIPSPALSQLNETHTQALASFCLQTWLQSGTEGAMTCLFHLADVATHHPFSDSPIVKDIVCTMLFSLGVDASFLPPFAAVEGQARPAAPRDIVVASLAVLIRKLVQNWLLSGAAAAELAPVLCVLFADRSSSPSTRDLIQSALREVWPVCLEEMLAIKICDTARPLPVLAQRDVLYAIGLGSEQAREISQWVGAGLLRPKSLTELAPDGTQIVPSAASIQAGLMVIIKELSKKAPDTADHILVDGQLSFFYLMMGDINALVDSLPLPREGDEHELDVIKVLLNRADGKIKRTVAATPPEIANKMRISQLGAILSAKLDIALARRRTAEEERRDEERRASGKGLQRGEGGQMKLDFGGKKAESVQA